jgi:excinuclease ABC subunit A
MTFLEENIINQSLSLSEGAILPWTAHPYYTILLEAMCKREKIPFHESYQKLTKEQKEKVLYGVEGVFEFPYTSKYEQEKTHHARFE